MHLDKLTDPQRFDRHRKRKEALFQEYISGGWKSYHQAISDNLLPRLGRFAPENANKVDAAKFSAILDQTGSRAHRILSSGVMTNKSSKAKPWFRLKVPDAELMEYWPVREWLHKMTILFQDIFAKSNTYRMLQSTYDEMTGFGTGPALVDRHFENIMHWTNLSSGQYAMSVDSEGAPEALYREFDMKVINIIRMFGIDKVSHKIRDAYDKGNYDQRHRVIHGIVRRDERDSFKMDNKNMPFESIYYEDNVEVNGNPLRVSGFRRFPGIAPRWDVLGNDTYGVCPPMYALGMVKDLYHSHHMKAMAIDYQVKPPLQYPSSLKGKGKRVLPGGIVYNESLTNNSKIQTLFDVNLDLAALLADVKDVRNQINEAFYVDLFLMMNSLDQTGRTAREVAERHEEKLLMLGPVDMRMDYELFDEVIDLTFDFVADARLEGGVPLMPPPPPELDGMELKIEYTSVLSQAQRLVGVEAIERTLGVIASLQQVPGNEHVGDKIDGDQIVDLVSDMFGADPATIVADDRVALIRKSRSEKAAQMEQAEAMGGMASMAKDASAAAASMADATGGNLSDLIGSVPGYGAQ